MKIISAGTLSLAALALACLAPVHALCAANCIQFFSPLAGGSYSSSCSVVDGALLTGDGTFVSAPGCEFRGFLVFNVPKSDVPIVSAELRVSFQSLVGPNESEVLELHEVTTSLNNLTRFLGDRGVTFADLADGTLLGSQVFRNLSPPPVAGFSDVQMSIPMTAAGVAFFNRAQGGQLALGTSVANSGIPSASLGGVRFSDGLERFHLVLRRADGSAPQVAMLPSSNTVLAGAPASLSAAVCGQEPLTTQWLKDGVVLAGETNSILFLNTVLPSDAGSYRLWASNELGTAISDPVVLPVSPLSILMQPTGFPISDVGAANCLSVLIASTSPLSYEWRKNGQTVLKTPSPYLCFSPTRLTDSGDYDVVVSNHYGSVTSAVALVRVSPVPPTLITYPSGTLSAAAGLPFELMAGATGTEPISFQWLKNGQPILDGGSNRVSFKPVLPSDAGGYQVIALSPYGAATSQVARLEVVPALFQGPFSISAAQGSRVVLWSQPFAIPETSLQWYHNGSKLLGDEQSFLVRNPSGPSDAGAYYVVADNVYGRSTSVVAQVVLADFPPSVSVYVSDTLPALLGDDLVISATTSGGPVPTVQWKRDGAIIPGATNETFVIRAASPADAGSYQAEVRNAHGSALSTPLQVDVVKQRPKFDVVPVDANEVVGSLVTLRAHALGGPLPTYRWRKDGVDLPGATNSTLILARARYEDQGRYEGFARNSEGEDLYAFDLTLRARTPLDSWNWSLPWPQGSRLLDIAWGDGRFVAVGKSGNIVTSTDGVHWERSLLETDCDLISVAYGNGRFVAVGLGRVVSGAPSVGGGGVPANSLLFGLVLTSSDGLNWTPQPSPSPYPGEIAFGNGVFVLTGAPDNITPIFNYTSTDGVKWVPQYNGWTRSSRVSFANGEFWASDQGAMYRSADGAAWQPGLKSLLGEPTGFLEYGGGQYVSMGLYGQFGQASMDGVRWTPFVVTNQGVQSLAYGNGRFVATLYYNEDSPSSGANPPAGSVTTSDDGRRWIQRDSGTRQELESVIFVQDRFWAVGEAGTITSSTNGVNWTPSLVANSIDYYGLTQWGDLIVAAGDDGTILTSTDGQAWTRQVTSSGRNLHTVQAGGGLIVAGGRGGRIMTSPDAVRWTTRTSGTSNYVERLAWGENRWVGACEGGEVITSVNGVDWTAVRLFPLSNHEGVAYGGGYWVAAGGYFRDSPSAGNAASTIFVSTNGVDWTFLNIDVGVRLRDVAYGDGKFVAVGNNAQVLILSLTGNPVRPVDYSTSFRLPNAYPWDSGPINFRRVQYANGRFVVVGNNGVVASSTDLTNSWVIHRSRTSQNLHDILPAADGSFYAVGNNGMILRSGVPQPRFTQVRRTDTGVRLEFTVPASAGPLRLEESEDMIRWSVLADPATSPVEVPVASFGARFFRLLTR